MTLIVISVLPVSCFLAILIKAVLLMEGQGGKKGNVGDLEARCPLKKCFLLSFLHVCVFQLCRK